MAAESSFGFGETGNSAIQSADLENPTVQPTMKWIGQPLAEIWPLFLACAVCKRLILTEINK